MSSLKQETRSQLFHRCGHKACLLRNSSLVLPFWPPWVLRSRLLLLPPHTGALFNNTRTKCLVFSVADDNMRDSFSAFETLPHEALIVTVQRPVSLRAPGSSQWFARCNYVAEMIIIVIISIYRSLKGGCHQGMGGIWTLPLNCKNRNGVKDSHEEEEGDVKQCISWLFTLHLR